MLRNASVRSAKGLLRARALLAAVVLAVILVGLGGWLLRPSPDLASPPPESAPAVTTEPAAAAADDAGAAAEAAGAVRGHQEDAPVLPGPPEWRALVVALPPEERAAWLAQWWEQARATQEEEVLAQWLVGFLASGLDLATGLDFAVGPGGALETAPTLRVQVLDWLGALAPELAAAEARAVLDRSPSPDEWAVALRNYGRTLAVPSEDAYYLDRVLMLLEQPSWQAGPTRGYLEAFDAAVHSGAEAVVEPLLALSLEAPHPGTRRVATMALDSLAGDDPLLVARVITAPGSPLREMPTFRASLMARLDPREPDHVAELSAYLLTVAEAGEERAAFAGSFPNLNDFAAHYLLTRQPGRNLVEMARTDLAAYELVRQWQTNPAFAARRDTLEAIEARLRPFLESAVRGGFLPAEELE